MNQLIKDEFIEKPENHRNKTSLKQHYFSNLFIDMLFFQIENFSDVINSQENENFKMIIGLFKMCSNEDSKTNLKN